MYIATKYIGTDYTPGEILTEDLDEALVKRLLKMGAIREDAPEPAFAAPDKTGDPADEDAGDAEDAGDEAVEDAEEAEDVEPEAPEVDAAAALVQESEEKPRPARTRKGGKAK